MFIRNNESLQVLNPLLHNFDGVFASQYDVNEYCYTMPMENGRIVDLNLPQSVTIILYLLYYILNNYLDYYNSCKVKIIPECFTSPFINYMLLFCCINVVSMSL